MELIKKIYKNDSLHIYTCKMKLSGEEEKMYFSAVNMGYGSIKYINTDNKESAISFLAAVVEHGMAVIVDDIPKFQCRKDSSKLLDCTDNEYVVPSTTSYYVAMKLFGFINYQVFDIKEIIDIDDMYKQHYCSRSVKKPVKMVSSWPNTSPQILTHITQISQRLWVTTESTITKQHNSMR